MLEQLFGSKTRVKLLKLFLSNPDNSYFVRELTRRTHTQINSIRRELENLEEIGILTSSEDGLSSASGKSHKKHKPKGQKRYYRTKTSSLMYTELRALFLKADLLIEKKFVERLKKLGNFIYLALTGVFVGLKEMPVDILIVGRINHDKLSALVKNFERETGKKINYTLMSQKEFYYRKNVTDRFLYTILENKKIVVVDRLSGLVDDSESAATLPATLSQEEPNLL